MSIFVRIYEGISAGQTTGVGMFNDNHCRGSETADGCQRNIEVQQIVKRKFLTMQDGCATHCRMCGNRQVFGPTVKGSTLVRIFSVTQELKTL